MTRSNSLSGNPESESWAAEMFTWTRGSIPASRHSTRSRSANRRTSPPRALIIPLISAASMKPAVSPAIGIRASASRAQIPPSPAMIGWYSTWTDPLSIAARMISCDSIRANAAASRVSTYASTRLRPPSLARYMAKSACRNRSSLLARGSVVVATPTDRLRPTLRPSTRNGARKLAHRRSPRATASCGLATSSAMTTNSSPPSRATVSCGRTAPRNLSATPVRTSSPAR